MYSLMTSISRTELFLRQLPTMIAALIVAELFYKFHSFLLECGAFLATWFVIDATMHLAWSRRGRPPTPSD